MIDSPASRILALRAARPSHRFPAFRFLRSNSFRHLTRPLRWDDWGGWYDHESPTIWPLSQGDYQYGFRVPLIVVSAYTPAGHISNFRYDFASILRFIERNFGIPEGQLAFADRRATRDLRVFIHLDQAPRPFQHVNAAKDASYFLNDKTVPTDPNDD